VFVPFQPCLMFVGKARSLPQSGALKGASLTLLPYPHIRLGWKGLPGTNTVAYWAYSLSRKKIKCSKKTFLSS
jgi:hypothetical protein